jgi:hypothetical protein
MLNGLVVALIGLVAALVGGAIQAFATGKFEKSKFEREAKWQTYTSYFATLGDLSFYHDDPERMRAAYASMAHLRGRIALYGSDDVIRAVAGIFTFADLKSDAAQAAMSKALAAMRQDVGYSSSVSNAELQALMFGTRYS